MGCDMGAEYSAVVRKLFAQASVILLGALAVENLRHAIRGHLEPPREFSRTHLQGVKFFGQVLPWVNWMRAYFQAISILARRCSAITSTDDRLRGDGRSN